MFSLVDELSLYFDVINDEDFVLGVDKTGIYVFTEDIDVDLVLVKYSRMLRTLALQQGEAVLCLVTDADIPQHVSTLHVVTPQSLESWVRKETGSRKSCFSKEDIQSIYDCYFESEDDEDSMYDVLREFNLPEPVVISLVNDPPETVQDITKFGIDRKTAYAVLDTFYDALNHLKKIDSSVERGVTVTLYSFIRRNVVIGIVLASCSTICVLLNFWWLATVFAVLGIIYSRKAEKVNDDVTAKFIKWSNILLTVLSLYPVLKYAIEYFVSWLMQNGFISG